MNFKCLLNGRKAGEDSSAKCVNALSIVFLIIEVNDDDIAQSILDRGHTL